MAKVPRKNFFNLLRAYFFNIKLYGRFKSLSLETYIED